jgi:hypothetical protein
MAAHKHAVLLVLLTLFIAQSLGNVVLLHDAHGKHCHQPKGETATIAAEGVASLVASLAGLVPAHKIDGATSKQVRLSPRCRRI